ncbi:MAG: class B sortase [Lachnospiraceae bacterium]|nr:class B sortase [Lachnospiraceae bacterium]
MSKNRKNTKQHTEAEPKTVGSAFDAFVGDSDDEISNAFAAYLKDEEFDRAFEAAFEQEVAAQDAGKAEADAEAEEGETREDAPSGKKKSFAQKLMDFLPDDDEDEDELSFLHRKEEKEEDAEEEDAEEEDAEEEEGTEEQTPPEDEGLRRFKIGEYVFESFHEYREAQEDVKKIEVINEELNIHDPEVAVRLYNMIRTGEITFKSPIGKNFFDHVADIVADKSVGLLEDKAVVDQAEGAVRYQKYLGMAVITVAVVLFSYFGYREVEEFLNTRRISQMQLEASENGAKGGGRASSDQAASLKGEDPFDKSKRKVLKASDQALLPEYAELVKQNSELVGWIRVDGTKIDYPVMQKDKDNSFYLNHDFDKKEDSNGSIFMDYRCDKLNPTINTILYGHNMKSGKMFGELKDFLAEDFFEKHKKVTFNTVYEHRKYEIVAVCLAKVADADDDGFRYYNFIDAENQNQWDAFMTSVGSLVVRGSMDFAAGDQVLTLSTCNNYIEDGRLFLLAKRVK